MPLTKLDIKKILSDKIIELKPSQIPHFSKLKNIEIATERVVKAIKNREKICLVSDYDVDGVVSATIVYQFFKQIDYPIDIIIPNRFNDGYGLTPKILDRVDATLLITADNGISSYEAATLCKNRGIDLIITDHHTPTYPLPEAYTIIDPKQKGETFPFVDICGAEVVWYLMASLNSALNSGIDMRNFLDYLVLAIIADVMPLNHINRILVKMGLSKLSKSNKPFAQILRSFFRQNYFSSEDIAFNIAPRLNSAGRMDDAIIAFNFLNADEVVKSRFYFDKLQEKNELRKEIERDITDFCIKSYKNEKCIVVVGDFHEGVIGIVASRLVHKYKVPAIVFSEKGDILKGSGRSLGDVHLYQLIEKCKNFTLGFGGHKLACGLTIHKNDFTLFKEMINREVEKIAPENFFFEEFILGEIELKECDFELVDIIEEFEPYGEANPRPKFKAKVKIDTIRNLKDNHYKLILSQNGVYKEGIIFRYNDSFPEEAEIIFTIHQNEFNGNRNIVLRIERIDK